MGRRNRVWWVGRAVTQETALSCLKMGGRMTMIGYSPERMSLNAVTP